MKIRAAIFDIGNVLLFFSHEKMWRQLEEVCGVPAVELIQKMMPSALAYEQGLITTEEVCTLFARTALKPHSQADVLHAMADIFSPNESIIPFVHQLKRCGTRLILLSNTCEAHFNFMEKHYPILQHFDAAVLSFREQARKPDAVIYRAALAAAQCAPEECLYLDDIGEYVEAGRSYGLRAELYTPAFNFSKHL